MAHIKINLEAFNQAAKDLGLNDAELARNMGISYTQLYAGDLEQGGPWYGL